MGEFATYYNELDKTYKEYLKYAHPEYEEKLVHNLRITVKKIKASFYFYQFSINGFNAKKNYLYYKRNFQLLGSIRDMQIQQAKFADWGNQYSIDFSSYLKYLKEEENLNKKQFSNSIRKTDWNNNIKIFSRINVQTSKSKIHNNVLSYLEMIIGNIREFDIDSFHTYEDLHNLRKQLKELQYNILMFESCMFKRKMFKTINKKLKLLTDELGSWHDNYNLLSHLFGFKLNFYRSKPGQIKRINFFERELMKSNSDQMNTIQRYFSDFCFYSLKIEKHWKNQI
jgi:CHAD domain-containing protein